MCKHKNNSFHSIKKEGIHLSVTGTYVVQFVKYIKTLHNFLFKAIFLIAILLGASNRSASRNYNYLFLGNLCHFCFILGKFFLTLQLKDLILLSKRQITYKKEKSSFLPCGHLINLPNFLPCGHWDNSSYYSSHSAYSRL